MAPKAAPKTTKAAPAKKAAVNTSATGVHVKGLGDASVQTVTAMFSVAGTVTDVRLRRNKFALVHFSEGANAVKKATETFAKSTTLTVTPAKAAPAKIPETKVVFVGPVFKQTSTKNAVRAVFAGAGKITKMHLYRQNYAKITFADAASAQKAIAKNGAVLNNHALRVKPAVGKH